MSAIFGESPEAVIRTHRPFSELVANPGQLPRWIFRCGTCANVAPCDAVRMATMVLAGLLEVTA